jgi:hypothetical protein
MTADSHISPPPPSFGTLLMAVPLGSSRKLNAVRTLEELMVHFDFLS